MRHCHQQVVDQTPILAAARHRVHQAPGSPWDARSPASARRRAGPSRPRSRLQADRPTQEAEAASAPNAITVRRLRSPALPARERQARRRHRSAAARGRRGPNPTKARSSSRPTASLPAPLPPTTRNTAVAVAPRGSTGRHAARITRVAQGSRLCCSRHGRPPHRSSPLDVCSCFVLFKVGIGICNEKGPAAGCAAEPLRLGSRSQTRISGAWRCR